MTSWPTLKASMGPIQTTTTGMTGLTVTRVVCDQYEAGDDSERLAELVPDPLNPENQVLRFQLTRPNVYQGNNG